MREMSTHAREHELQQFNDLAAGSGAAGAQEGTDEVLLGLVVERDEREEGQVAPTSVVRVEQRELLRAVDEIIGEVEIDRDPLQTALQSAAMTLKH